jgi:ATP-dependent DNA ligase
MRTFTYASSSSDSKHKVTVHADGRAVCTCRGFRNPSKCWHVRDAAAGGSKSLEGATAYNAAPAALSRPSASAPTTAASGRGGAAGFVSPMLASPLEPGFVVRPGEWVAEEKFNGQRRVVVKSGGSVVAYSRPSATNKDRVLTSELPPHVAEAFKRMPDGVYDGEEMGHGNHHSDVRRVETRDKNYFVVFDLLNFCGEDLCPHSYDARRAALVALFNSAAPDWRCVRLAESHPVDSCDAVARLAANVWKLGGEGLILKRRASLYQPGRRSKDFVKVKKVQHAVLTVVGFEAGKNGPFSKVALRDANGIETTVKTKNTKELRRLENATAHSRAGFVDSHPAVGRRLMVEYSELTRDGKYENIRWDRWEDE